MTYYTQRFFTDYQVPFMLTFFINFAVPFYTLIATRYLQRQFIVPVGLLIFIGHFADVYLLVIPGNKTTTNSVFLKLRCS